MSLLSFASWNAGLRLLYRKSRRHLQKLDRSRLEVRPLQATDLPVLERLGPKVAPGTYAKDWQDQQAGLISMLVVWYGNRPVAAGLVHWSGPRQDAVQTVYPGCPEIFRLHVHPDYRSLGIGSLMIDAFERMARARGLDQIGLGVNYDNPQAFALYQRLGYGEPQPSDFMDEFDAPQRNGRIVHHSHRAHFLVKSL